MNTMNSATANNTSSPFTMNLMGLKVRKLREIYGYSQEFVAFQIGISQAAYSKKESGRTDLSLSCLSKLANIYCISMIDLISLNTQELLLKVIQTDSKMSSLV
ncbi:Helix-turn-helix domain-containing protein [Dyadobacter koreensis]|jgi:transcriptional regulator with XRE-family HTH domain|uniref:Helix-turn-helix domain-containing protein n=1 Tax=Dyadobacter koreensis TaxID=408657 RepID=A0A1H7A795_9BACT|nr:helix-turn-helix transcriptional regulator [Dyadobacter koreensis]SEJ61288.1 Helix-turn-helix domain-containing protein [Dyadobacter koreensis]